MSKFEVGKTYACRSICDSNSVFKYEIVKRSDKKIWIKKQNGKIERRGIFVFDGVEASRPE